jgi:hypothetical protein
VLLGLASAYFNLPTFLEIGTFRTLAFFMTDGAIMGDIGHYLNGLARAIISVAWQ